MQPRPLNWFGWSIETIAAVYESDAACVEFESGVGSESYIYSAFRAEEAERDLDAEYGT
jgi:hypothetical protein